MRFSTPLLANVNRYHLLYKQLWKVKGKRKILESPVPKLLTKKGVPIIEAQKLVEPPAKKLELIEVPEPWTPPPPHNDNHPKWNSRVCHQYSNGTKVAEGLLQAQLLTKTVVHEGLPKQIENLIGIADQQDQDELVQRCILNSQIYDGWQSKLPKAIDLSRLGYPPPRPYGTPLIRKLQLLLRHLIRLTESQTGIYTEILHRSILTLPECVITTQKNGDLLQFRLLVDTLITAKEPLQPFTSKEEAAKVNSAELPNIFPVKYTIDLTKTNIYDNNDFFPINKAFSNPYIHTLYLTHIIGEHGWSKTQKLAKAVVACYTAAASQARWLYGNVKDLPEPIAVQCVLTNGPQFTLVAYQLNTLNLDDNDKARNMAWIAPELQMYDICKQESGKVHFGGYNPEVYKWLLAMHLNGLTLSSPLSTSHLMPSRSAQSEQLS